MINYTLNGPFMLYKEHKRLPTSCSESESPLFRHRQVNEATGERWNKRCQTCRDALNKLALGVQEHRIETTDENWADMQLHTEIESVPVYNLHS